jgi:hypothetical protein
MTELEELWHGRSDEQLFEALSSLEEYSQDGQKVIHAEFVRRGLTEPARKPITFEEAVAVRVLQRRFIGLVGTQWVSLGLLSLLAPTASTTVGFAIVLLCAAGFSLACVLVPVTGYKLLKRLEVKSPGGLAILMLCMPLFSLLVVVGIRSFTKRWSKEYGVQVDFFGPTKQGLARLGGVDGAS